MFDDTQQTLTEALSDAVIARNAQDLPTITSTVWGGIPQWRIRFEITERNHPQPVYFMIPKHYSIGKMVSDALLLMGAEAQAQRVN